MIRFLLITFLVSSIWALPRVDQGLRIIGGDDAKAGQYPFAASIYTKTSTGTYFCVGALISNQWVITSGTCVYGVMLFTITLGATKLSETGPEVLRLSTDNYMLHPDFDSQKLDNDVGLIKLRLPITLSDYVQPIKFPVRDIQPYAVVTAIGWGQTSDADPSFADTLQSVTVTALSNVECKLTFGNQITDRMVCVDGNYNQGTCLGDIGGPLIQYVSGSQATIVGVASFISGNGCESPDPSGYARTYPYLTWIKNVTGIV